MYEYKADLRRVVDGDTIDVSLNVGFDIVFNTRIRLLGINAPESRTRDLVEKEKGLAAKDWLIATITDKEIVIKTTLDKKGKFGRVLGEIFVDGVNINQQMITEGHAVVYNGGKR